MKVRDIMTPNPRTAEPDTTLEEIATLMKQEDVGVIPVMEDNRVTGIVTDRDIVVRCIAAGKDPTECTAEDIMSEGVNTIAPDADVDEAADLMAEEQVRRLAVVENGRLVGMLSLGDIAVKTGDEDEETTAETLEEVSKGVKGTGRQASGRNAGRDEQEFDEESEVEMAGSGARQSGRDRANWNQGDREAARGGADSRRVASAERWEGGRGSNDREGGRMQQSQSGRGSRQPSVRGRSERNDRRADERPQGRNGRDDRREREEKRAGQQKKAAQGISNRNLGRENARQQKVAPKRAEARGSRNAGRKRAG